jgi:hypothetical protein
MMATDDDFDSPWKEAIEAYFTDFMAFFLPEAYAEINWVRGYVFLDKELQQVVQDAELGRRLVDKLVQIWLNDGSDSWVLIHIEVQGQHETAFAERMYVYNSHLYHYHKREVNSLVVLADTRTRWRPHRFRYGRWGTEMRFSFPGIKLADYRKQWTALEASPNPFATVVMAHLKTQETRTKPQERERWKWALTRRLYTQGYGREDILRLFRFIDWLMRLPRELEETFRQQVYAYEEAQRMPYVTSIEQIGIEKGRREELLSAIDLLLKLKFGEAGLRLMPEISQLEDLSLLRAVRDNIWTVATLEEVHRMYRQDGA